LAKFRTVTWSWRRNVLAHGYATLDHRRVYEIASSRADELLKTLETLLAQMPEA
jgi:uncharacterized protein YutE (UPF0331/DUF86 family)